VARLGKAQRMRTMSTGIWKERLDRLKAVLKEGRGHFVVVASYATGGTGWTKSGSHSAFGSTL
jgi:hypothetical protein